MLDCNYIDLFTFTFFLLRPASVTWQRTYTTLKLLNHFFDHLHWKHVPLTISFYIRQMRHISSGVQSCTYAAHQRSKYGMWAKVFKYLPPFQQSKGMPADCFCNPNFCVIYTLIIYFSDPTEVSSFTLSNPTANCCWQVWFYCTSSENMFPLLFPC